MSEIVFNDFSSGWCPSDDPISGRKNGLLRMDSLELDRNGTLSMSGGIQTLMAAYPAAAVAIYSIFLNGTRTRYAVVQNGANVEIYRNNTRIAFLAQTVTRAAFGAAYNFVIICAGNLRIKDNGTTVTNLGLATPTSLPPIGFPGPGNLNGDYDYVQIVVRSDGNGYVAKSAPSPKRTVAATNEMLQITPAAPTTVDPQANETWIFRRGGTLDHYYRVYVATTGAAFNDNLSDEDALIIGITLNTLALPVNISGIPEAILGVIGPIYGRHIYISAGKIYPGEINSPDSIVDPNKALGFAGNQSELYLWSYKVAENVILIGTTIDVYILTGTFITQPDGTLDWYLRPMGVSAPPIGIDASITSDPVVEKTGNVVYMSASGWVSLSASGSLNLLSDVRVDRLYRGNTAQTYGGVPIYIYPTLRYACCIAKNKLWVSIPAIVGNNPAANFTRRMEVFDFKRNYWRPLPFQPSILFSEQDGNIIGFFPSDNTIKDMDAQFTRLVDGAKQTVDLFTFYQNAETPTNNKDALSLKIKGTTGNDALTVTAFTDGTTQTDLGTITSNLLGDSYIPVAGVIPTFKTIQFRLSGQIANLILNEIIFEYSLHPVSVLGFAVKNNYGPNKKRIRTWPMVLDCLGGSVTFTPIVDGVAGTTSVFTGAGRKTYLHYFTTDVFGVDFEGKLTSTTPFEVWEVETPNFVEILPIAKRFDQLGPVELFKYGKIKAFQVRIIAFGGTSIPYRFYFEDVSIYNDTVTVVNGKESTVEIPLPRGVAGTILRLELGATSFDFHVIDTRVQAALSGKDTELTWMPLSKLMEVNK